MQPGMKPAMNAMHDGAPQAPMDAESSGEQPESGYAIEIRVYPDGRIVVSREPLRHEMMEEASPGEQPETDRTEVSDFEDALLAAVKIYKANPINASDAAQFDAGFAQGHGIPSPMGRREV